MHKYGLKCLGLAVMAVMGLMAFSASSALAANLNVIMEPETATLGFFLANTGTTNPTGLTAETIAASSSLEGKLLIPKKSAEVVCAKAKLVSGSVTNEFENWLKLAMKAGGHGKGEAIFEECKVFKINLAGELTLPVEELKSCTNTLNGVTAPHNITAKGLLWVVRHEGSAYLVVEPEATSKATAEANTKLTSSFTTLTFKEPCSLPEKNEIHGGIAVKAPAADAVKPELSVKSWQVNASKEAVSSVEQELLGAQLTFGANPAFIEANKIIAELTGAGKALPWGAM